MAGYFFVWRNFFSQNIIIGTIAAIVISLIFALLYREDLVKFFNIIKGGKEDSEIKEIGK